MFFRITCSLCGKPVTTRADSEGAAIAAFKGMEVCPSGLHPSFPNVWENSEGLVQVGWFGFLHSGK